MFKQKYWVYVVLTLFILGAYAIGFFVHSDENKDKSFSPIPENNTNISYSDQQSITNQNTTISNQLPKNNYVVEQKQQMVYQANISLQAANIQKVKSKIEYIATKTKSYIINSSESEKDQDRYVQITYHVPQNQFENFIEYCKDISDTPPSIQINSDDVGGEIVDLQARLKAKQAMETRLIAMMKQADTTNDLLNIENTLGSVQEQVEQLTSRMQYLQHLVHYSTVSITILPSDFPFTHTSKSFWSRMIESFISSCITIWLEVQQFVLLFISILPYLLLLTVIGYPTYLIVKKKRKKE